MKKALLKDCFKEIIKGFKRFISILLIVLLGVGFFAGIKATSPDMKLTLDTYFDDKNVFDIQVISTLGLTNSDIEELKKLDLIENAEGTYQTDALVTAGEKQVVVKMESIPDSINGLELTSGRLPENTNECVVEDNFLLGTEYKIGDTIEINVDNITDDDGNDITVLKNNKLQIVGTVRSPMYISSDRGDTKLGSGVINYYIYVNKENINAGIFTNIYLTVNGAKDLKCYDDEYKDLIADAEDDIEEIAEERKEARYNELYEKANKKFQDAKNEFEQEKADGEKKLQDAENEINSSKQKLEDGKDELAANRNLANTKFQDAADELEKARSALQENENNFNSKKEEAEKQIQDYEGDLATLKEIQTQYNNLKNSLETNKEELQKLNDELKTLDEIEDAKRIEEINLKLTELNGEIAKI